MWGEIRRGWQEAAMGVSGQGEKSLSPKTQKTIITMQFGRYSTNGGYQPTQNEFKAGAPRR